MGLLQRNSLTLFEYFSAPCGKFSNKSSIKNINVGQKNVGFGEVFNSWIIVRSNTNEFGCINVFYVL